MISVVAQVNNVAKGIDWLLGEHCEEENTLIVSAHLLF
jgi:hypothetical protein